MSMKDWDGAFFQWSIARHVREKSAWESAGFSFSFHSRNASFDGSLNHKRRQGYSRSMATTLDGFHNRRRVESTLSQKNGVLIKEKESVERTYHIGSMEALYQALQHLQVHPSFQTPSCFFRTLTWCQSPKETTCCKDVSDIFATSAREFLWCGSRPNLNMIENHILARDSLFRFLKPNDEQKVGISNTIWKSFLWIVKINLS